MKGVQNVYHHNVYLKKWKTPGRTWNLRGRRRKSCSNPGRVNHSNESDLHLVAWGHGKVKMYKIFAWIIGRVEGYWSDVETKRRGKKKLFESCLKPRRMMFQNKIYQLLCVDDLLTILWVRLGECKVPGRTWNLRRRGKRSCFILS